MNRTAKELLLYSARVSRVWNALALALAVLAITPAHATDAVYRAAVTARWCQYLGPDCEPHGLSDTAQQVFQYLMADDQSALPAAVRRTADREIAATERAVAAGDVASCKDVRELLRVVSGRVTKARLALLMTRHCR